MGKLEFYSDGQGRFRWRLRARNGRIVADCGQGYHEKRDCESGARFVMGETLAGHRIKYTW